MSIPITLSSQSSRISSTVITNTDVFVIHSAFYTNQGQTKVYLPIRELLTKGRHTILNVQTTNDDVPVLSPH